MSNKEVYIEALKLYFTNVGIALSQFLSALLGFDPDEPFSAVTYKYKDKNIVFWLVWRFLEILDKDHGFEAVEPDEGENSVWAFLRKHLNHENK
jgi:hypothetical protein